jgi:hypothetical protein
MTAPNLAAIRTKSARSSRQNSWYCSPLRLETYMQAVVRQLSASSAPAQRQLDNHDSRPQKNATCKARQQEAKAEEWGLGGCYFCRVYVLGGGGGVNTTSRAQQRNRIHQRNQCCGEEKSKP